MAALDEHTCSSTAFYHEEMPDGSKGRRENKGAPYAA